jgi:hypothetical protein
LDSKFLLARAATSNASKAQEFSMMEQNQNGLSVPKEEELSFFNVVSIFLY